MVEGNETVSMCECVSGSGYVIVWYTYACMSESVYMNMSCVCVCECIHLCYMCCVRTRKREN